MAGLEIKRPGPPAPVGLIADRRLYLSGDKARLLEEGDAAAAYLFVTAGKIIPASDAKRLGLALANGRVVQVLDAEPPKKGK